MQNRFIKTSIVVSIILSLGVTIVTADNLIQNGSFEDFTVNKDHGSWKEVNFTNWSGDGELWNSKIGKPAIDGAYKIELDVGKELNELSQSVTTIKDKKYKLSIDAYARKAGSSDFEVLVDDVVIATIKPDSEWAEYDVYFDGIGTEQTISIKEIESQSDGLGTVIDNIRLKESLELIKNGSFENFIVNKDHGVWKEVSFNSWEGLGEAWNNGLGERSTNGAYKIELDVGNELNSLSQEVMTKEHLEYELSLDAYARRDKSSDFEIWIDDEKLETVTPTKNWDRYSFKFFGNGKAQKIQIKEIESQSDSYGTVIDNISLIPTGKINNPKPAIDMTKNIANLYGIATQPPKNGFYYYKEPSLAIDGNLSTNNHTQCSAPNNWLQIELPHTTEVKKIVLHNVKGQQYRLNGSTLYLSNNDFNGTGTIDSSNMIATLNSDMEQSFDFNETKSGSYLLIKGNEEGDNSCLHLTEVEVYGATPPEPVMKKDNYLFGLEHNSSIGSVIGKVEAIDYQDDKLSYTIVGDVPFNIDNNGVITLKEEINHNKIQSFTFKVKVSDKFYSDLADVEVKLLENKGVNSERWYNISGASISNLIDSPHFKDKADEITTFTQIDMDEKSKDNFGQRFTTILKPNESGEYIFAIVGDDATELRLDGKKIASKSSWSSYQNWSSAGKSEPIKLDKGGIYKLEALLKESGGAERISVGWKKVGDSDFKLISADELFLNILTSENVKPFIENIEDILISGSTENGTVVTSVKATDLQSDTLTYSIVGDVPFIIDNSGDIIVNGVLDSREYNFNVTVSDGTNSVSTPINIKTTSSTAVDDAINSGEVTNVTTQELLEATRAEITSLKDGDDALIKIYGDNSISYSPAYNSQLINIHGDAHKVFPILEGNKGNTLAVAGRKESSNFAIFGSNPFYFFEHEKNLDYQIGFKNLLAWLMKTEPSDLNSSKTIALSFVSYSNDIKSWLSSNFSSWNVKDCNDMTSISTCQSGADLVMIGSSTNDTIADSFKSELENRLKEGTPLLYVHPNWGQNKITQAVGSLFDVSFPYGGNWWSDDKANWNNSTEMQTFVFSKLKYNSIDTMLSHFQAEDYIFDWSQCKNSNGERGENYDNCSDVSGLSSQFQDGADRVKYIINSLDKDEKNIFTTSDYRLEKLFVLIGDKFRQTVTYPMDKVKTDDNEFMKSYYADHAVYNYRTFDPVQPDMGNFSRSNFSDITPTTRRVNILSRKYFRSTGAYALPGQTVKITRNDSSDLRVKVFINTLRSGATHQYQINGYNRPKYLQTPHFEIKSGQTIELTSPYGGTLQLEFNKNDLPVDVTFENIGEHPYWASSKDDDSFAQKLDAGEFDWAEVVTEGFEVHSKLDKMRKSVEDIKWGTAEKLAHATEKYMYNYPHLLAGFQGEGIDKVDEVFDFASSNGLTIETLDMVKHMNADQATCGYGCSGNPYDAYWAFSPIGHGDVHELGHGLQKYRFQFEGFPNHAATNFYSYFTKSKYFEATGEDPNCQKQSFKEVFEKLQASRNEANPTEYLKTNLWAKAGLGEQYVLVLEAMMHAQKMGKLKDGWLLWARLHILEREISRAKEDWEAKKASIGFSNYTLDEFNSMRANDWLVVSFSYATGLDYTTYFDMMGIEFSQKAREQIKSFGYEKVPNTYFVSTPTGYCKSDEYGTLFDRETLNIDGTTKFPY